VVTPDEVTPQLRRGAVSMLSSTFLFALVGVGVKLSSRTAPDAMIVFFRNAGALAGLLPFLVRGGPAALATRRLPSHLFRSLAGLASMYACFYALARMPLGDAMVLCYTSPLFMPGFSKFWMKERLPAGTALTMTLGFIGAALVMKPGLGVFRPAAFVALASGLSGAAAQVGIRDLTTTEPVPRILFYFSATSTLMSAIPLLWSWRTPVGVEWVLLVGTGLTASAAQYFLTQAYRLASPSRVGPFIYAAVVYSALFDWVFWRHHPDVLSFLGASLIILAGVLVLRRGGRPDAGLPAAA
jgi:drug/metabolite transporter (DMT)-like permease